MSGPADAPLHTFACVKREQTAMSEENRTTASGSLDSSCDSQSRTIQCRLETNLALTSQDKQLRVRERRKAFRFLEAGEKIFKKRGVEPLFWQKKKKALKRKEATPFPAKKRNLGKSLFRRSQRYKL